MSEVMKHQRQGYFPVKEIIYNMLFKTVMLLLVLYADQCVLFSFSAIRNLF